MKCPKCEGEFETLQVQGIEVERCTACYGLWFDMLEHEDLKIIDGAEAIDIGDKDIGRKQDDKRRINCPKCELAMIEMVDKDQFHIRFEGCPSCHGTYFDAGEFRDFKNHTIFEQFRQMFDTFKSNIQ